MEIVRRTQHNIVCRQRMHWDFPNLMRADTGERVGGYGFDYSQGMVLWHHVAALKGQDLSGPRRPDGLVERVVAAATGERDAQGRQRE